MGVTQEGSKFRVRVTSNGKRKNLGQFKTYEEAKARLNKHHAELDEQEKFHTAFNKVQAIPLFDPNEYPRLDIEKESWWDRIKSVWQRKQNDN